MLQQFQFFYVCSTEQIVHRIIGPELSDSSPLIAHSCWTWNEVHK